MLDTNARYKEHCKTVWLLVHWSLVTSGWSGTASTRVGGKAPGYFSGFGTWGVSTTLGGTFPSLLFPSLSPSLPSPSLSPFPLKPGGVMRKLGGGITYVFPRFGRWLGCLSVRIIRMNNFLIFSLLLGLETRHSN